MFFVGVDVSTCVSVSACVRAYIVEHMYGARLSLQQPDSKGQTPTKKLFVDAYIIMSYAIMFVGALTITPARIMLLSASLPPSFQSPTSP